MSARPRAIALLLAALAMAGALGGCEVPYLMHGAYEEVRLLWKRRPIEQVLELPDLPPDIRAKLKLVLAVRDFARDNLGLNVGGAYSSVVPVDKSAVTWVLMAAPPDQLVPHTWYFPIVGDVPYKGFFSRHAAQAAAADLQEQGLDTFVRSAVAFSSLGWFDDPLLSNLLGLDQVVLAGVIIHELFHRTYYLAGDAMFDESAASWIGNAGAVRFFELTQGPNSPQAVAARAVLQSDLTFAAFLKQEVARLLLLYASKLPRAQMLRRRKLLFASIQADYARLRPQLSGLERFDLDRQPLNNAVIINYRIYFHRLDAFDALNHAHEGDLRATIASIIALAKAHPDHPFEAISQAVSAAPRSAATAAIR
ncbi:MAG TPA: aminopeptidase [Candidatus Binataceae bacterium]|nr:aminopeptidase [Candidatus Binataceae bacterium]